MQTIQGEPEKTQNNKEALDLPPHFAVRWDGGTLLRPQPAMVGLGSTKGTILITFTLNKLECSKQAVITALNTISMG